MIIDIIDNIHLKAELTEQDMKSLEISLDSFTEKSEQAKLVLKSILKNAYEQTGFDIFSTHLLIEVFPIASNGCIILFTRSVKNKKMALKLKNLLKKRVFVFKNIDDLFSFSEKVKAEDFSPETSLFLYKGSYCLSLCFDNRFSEKYKLLLSEFNAESSEIPIQVLLEHADLLIKEDVINSLKKYC